MSQEQLFETLTSLGLTRMDSQIYLFLAKKGSQKAKGIAKPLKMNKQQIYRSIANLQSKGIVSSNLERPSRFTAVSFDKVLDLLVKTKMEEAKQIQKSKAELLSVWQSIHVVESDTSAKFMVLEGRNVVYSKILQMVQETKKQLFAVSTVPGLARADQQGLFDALVNHPLKSSIQFRFLTELSEQNFNIIKNLLKIAPKTNFSLKVRNPDLGLRLFPRLVIRDKEEIVFFITQDTGGYATEQDDTCLWTNCASLVQTFSSVFEDLWRNSTDIEKKIVEIETGKQPPVMHFVGDAETASKKYDELLRSAKKDIIVVTSAEGLLAHREKIERLKNWATRGVSVRILAPINNENLQAAHELSKCAAVRHLSDSYLETTVIDGKHLFQFKNQPSEAKKRGEWPYFENAFYTNDLEYVEKTSKMLNVFWQNARAPPTVTLETVLRPSPLKVAPFSDDGFPFSRAGSPYRRVSGFVECKPEILREEDVLKKIIDAKKFPAENWPKDITRYYGSCAMAIIHPVKRLNIPNTMIFAWHFDKPSSFGVEDSIRFCLWLQTEKGPAYLPVTLITDNAKSGEFQKKKITAGSPLSQNVRLVKKDEIQVRIHNNSAIAAWTVPIPLPPSRYVLPPACVLVEGYSRLKTAVTKFVLPSGVNILFEGNGYDGFVTFFHPASKYTGPGTDGSVGRDVVVTEYLPSNK